MRVLLMATMAASALAIGANVEPAQSLPLGGQIASPDAAVQKVQQKEKGAAPGSERKGQGGPAKGGPGVGGPGMGGKMQGQGGAQLRSGERGGTYGYGPRTRERGVYIERGRRGHRGGVYVGPGYGYGPGCGWLRRRALETGSAYWWRRYRACRGW